jgi:hypothetical protein
MIAKLKMNYKGDTTVVWNVWCILSVYINKSDNPFCTYTLKQTPALTPTPKTSIIYDFTAEYLELGVLAISHPYIAPRL